MEALTITPEQAAERLRALGMKITPTTIREGMAQNRFPFGDYIKTEKSCVCYVYPRLLERWIAEHFGNLDEVYGKRSDEHDNQRFAG